MENLKLTDKSNRLMAMLIGAIVGIFLLTLNMVSFMAAIYITLSAVLVYVAAAEASPSEPPYLRMYRATTMVVWLSLFYIHFVDSHLMPKLAELAGRV